VKAWGKPSLGWRRWLVHRGGFIRIVFELRTWWVPNIGTKWLTAITSPKHEGECEGPREHSDNKCGQ
jgi:hypothetical protein